MSSEIVATPPSVSWAQNNTNLFLTFNVECEKPDIKIEKNLVYFKGVGAPEQKTYEVNIPLYAEVDPDTSSHLNKGRIIEIVLTKQKKDDMFWPSLTSDKKKHHWLRVDFNRWQDEEDSTDDEMNSQCGQMFSDKPFSDNYDYNDSSSNEEEEDLPDIH